MKVLIRTDFGTGYGFGHISRTLSLATAMLSQGCEVTFASMSPLASYPRLSKLVSRHLVGFHQLPRTSESLDSTLAEFALPGTQRADAVATVKVGGSLGADLVIFDHYGVGSEWVSIVRDFYPVCAVTDFPASYSADFIIDYGFDATEEKHSLVPSARRTLLGPSFALVSQDYSVFEAPPDRKSNGRNHVLIALGSLKSPGPWISVSSAIRELLPETRLLLAGVNPEALKSIAARIQNLEYLDTDGLSSLFAAADFAIVGGGVTMYEMLASGTPGFAVGTALNQHRGLSAALASKAVVGTLEADEESIKPSLANSIQSFESDTLLHWLQSRSVIDHHGAQRAALLLRGIDLSKGQLRKIQMSDVPFALRLANQPSIRNSSMEQGHISSAEHLQWSKGFFDGSRIGWVFEVSNLPVALCRIETEGDRTFLSYGVQEEFQGNGIASTMLSRLFSTYLASKVVYARSRTTNVASVGILSKNGFRVVERTDEQTILVRTPM